MIRATKRGASVAGAVVFAGLLALAGLSALRRHPPLAEKAVDGPPAPPGERAPASTVIFVATDRPGRVSENAAMAPSMSPATARATACALGSLAPFERAALRTALEDLATRAEARANPLAEDLEDGVPEEALTKAAQYFLPTFTAARSLAAGEWASADGKLIVRAVRRCADAAGPCLPLYGDQAATADQRRARFLAWPLSTAAILRARDGAAAARVALTLRSGARDGSRIALVLSGGDLRDQPGAFDEIRRSAQSILRWTERSPSPGARALALLAAPAPSGALAPFVGLADDEVLVVPRMGALSEIEAFAREVRERLRGGKGDEAVAWEVEPRALEE